MYHFKFVKGFNQVVLWEVGKEKNIFYSPPGLYHLNKMPFILHEVAATFLRLMDKVLQLISDFALAYIDNTIEFSWAWHKHKAHIKATLMLLWECGFTANPNKCLI